MNRETSIPEVARHMPMEAAGLLRVQTPIVQEKVLEVIRELMCSWEESGAQLDPLQWELILNGVVATMVPLYVDIMNKDILMAMVLGDENVT